MEIFSKLLSKTDSTVRLAIPTSAQPHFHNFVGRDLPVIDWTGQEWSFRFSIRRGGHPKPVFIGDWAKFARAKGLQLNDRLIFTLEDGTYRIEVSRKTHMKLFGQNLWIHVDNA
ncbi:hypothetical protein Pint_28692 [Pistacia integerrima]|uniref:Uncharacterized protein n=1 Tax=Pistacia integerrima TaxID=434235 RepID=A0ACC0YSL3_9ROSI|nr:hypothetical protein Pint_28692 [Pistacia integerrima]